MIENGIYCQADGDKGDAAHRTGLALSCFWVMGAQDEYASTLNAALSYCKLADGQYVRHIKPLPGCEWQADPLEFSRDQASTLFQGLAFSRVGKIVSKKYYDRVLQSFTHQNGDLIGFGELPFLMRLYLEDLWLILLYPVLTILDLVRYAWDIPFHSKWDGAALFVPSIHFANNHFPTIGSWLAAKIVYAKKDIKTELIQNHALEKNGCIELQPLLAELFERLK